jgi:glycosidase
MAVQTREIIQEKLAFLYGAEAGGRCAIRLLNKLEQFKARYHPASSDSEELFSERDVVLITYGDLLRSPDATPLATLTQFLTTHLQDTINTVHVLPFFPYSSDDGFSIVDYRAVNPDLGSWKDIHRLEAHFHLMVDAVLNHVSTKSDWFQGFLRGERRYQDFFITEDPATDLSSIVRPRPWPLLTPFQTASGEQHVWTTFSADQVDLNFANPDVLLEIIDVLLFYLEQGAKIIRLDAIAYIWKEVGTPSIHLPQVHAIVRLMRAVLDEVAPGALLITETNVPHEENISYFGEGDTDEAHLVYQFPLPPLTAHAFMQGTARYLTEWAATLSTPSPQTGFFNFTASHDGVGVRPLDGLVPRGGLEALIDRARASGGQTSYKTNADGSKSPYELNVTYYDLLNPPNSGEPQSLQVARFLASQAIMLALAGIPGIYFHSLLGSRNFSAGVKATRHPRTINREKLSAMAVEAELRDPATRRYAVFYAYRDLIQKRIAERSFHPNASQRILTFNDAIFGLLRIAQAGDEGIIALHNVSGAAQQVSVDPAALGIGRIKQAVDLISGGVISAWSDGILYAELAPYQVMWLKFPIKDR